MGQIIYRICRDRSLSRALMHDSQNGVEELLQSRVERLNVNKLKIEEPSCN